jgi:hypothetical protein
MGKPAARLPLALAVAILAACCGGRPGGGPAPVEPDDVTAPAGPPLSQESYLDLFEEDQAAYYIDYQDTVWLVMRVAEGHDDATLTKVALHLLTRLVQDYDLTSDERSEVVIIVYMGALEQRANYGIKASIEDLARVQRGELSMAEMMESLSEIVDIDLMAIRPYITE